MSDIQDLIIQTATQVFEDHCTTETLRLAEGGVWPAELWAVLEQTGLPLASLPETVGGSGGSLSDALAVLRIAGQFAVPLPLAETYLASWILAASGVALPSGPLTVAFTRGDTAAFQFRRRASTWKMTGIASRVSWARHARQLVALGQSEDGPCLALLAPGRGTISPDQNLAGEPRDTISFADVEVTEVVPLAVTPDWIWSRAALTRSVLMVGALEGMLQRTVRYASERVQFGRPISRFQAIQQQLALLAGEVAASRTSVEAAALIAEQEDEATAAIAIAKIRVGEAAGQAAAIAHQVHGAMGYTYEYPLHFLTKRLWTWRDESGSESEWARWLGQHIAAQGAEALWPFLTT